MSSGRSAAMSEQLERLERLERIERKLDRLQQLLEEILDRVQHLAGEPAPGERGLGH